MSSSVVGEKANKHKINNYTVGKTLGKGTFAKVK